VSVVFRVEDRSPLPLLIGLLLLASSVSLALAPRVLNRAPLLTVSTASAPSASGSSGPPVVVAVECPSGAVLYVFNMSGFSNAVREVDLGGGWRAYCVDPRRQFLAPYKLCDTGSHEVDLPPGTYAVRVRRYGCPAATCIEVLRL